MQRTIVPGVSMWSVWQTDRNVYFNSYFIEHGHENLVVDPLAMTADVRDEIVRRGVGWIAITNRDHEREAFALAALTGAKLVASAIDAPLLSGPVDRTVVAGEYLCGAIVVALDGLKTAGEFALYWEARDTVLVGDALWGDPAGSLRLMADEKLIDPPRAVLSLRQLRALRPKHILVGDGACIFGDADAAIWAALEARVDTYANRMNLDEVAWRASSTDSPEIYRGEDFDIGAHIGAERLGYRLARIPPGKSYAPDHWHLAEEELFVVLEGDVTLESPRGEWELRRGDFVSFPTRPSGAHRLINRTLASCTLLLVANTEETDVCFYPRSQKVLIEKTDHLVRDHPQLSYWDHEREDAVATSRGDS